MNYLLLEFSGTDGKVFNLTIESYISMFLWKLLNAQYEIKLKLMRTKFVALTTVPVNFDGVKHEIEAEHQDRKMPMLELDGCYNVVGLCSVLRGMCRIMKTSPIGELATQLLGFKENCLMSPSEVSNWTNFCEREMLACAEQLMVATGEIQFPLTMIKFERDLANPVRVHNVYKVARDAKKDKSIKSGSEVEIEHKFCHGSEVNLSDVVLYSIYKLIFSSTVNVDDVQYIIPLTLKWFQNMEALKFNEVFEFLRTETEIKRQSLSFVGEVPEVNEDGKYFSLFNRELTGFRGKNKKVFTEQTGVDVVLEKLKTLKIKISSKPGDQNQEAISDDYVSELLTCGELPAQRFDRKKSQLKSLANEVLKIARPGDVIVDFCSGTGHLGLLVAKLLPECRVIVLENKEESINRAKAKADKLQMTNVTFYQCNLEYFNEKFTIGLSLHACGVATDLVLRNCWKHKAAFICSPCCYGKIQDLGSLPQSEMFRQALSSKDLINISHCSDQTHDAKNVKHINIEKAQQGYFCMDVIDTDRLLKAKELGYSTLLTRMHPEDCTLKNRLLVGVFNKL